MPRIVGKTLGFSVAGLLGQQRCDAIGPIGPKMNMNNQKEAGSEEDEDDDEENGTVRPAIKRKP